MGSVLFGASDSKDLPPFTIRLNHGTVVSRQTPYNSAWSFHPDPDSIGAVEWAVEGCDVPTKYVQDNLDTVGSDFLPEGLWCPWGLRLESELPAGTW